MAYQVEIISLKEKEKLMEDIYSSKLFEKKAAIHGTCIKFFTDSKLFKEMWEDNFDQMPESIRPHGRIFSIKGKKLRVLYEPFSKTAIIEGCDYYGYIKSIALAIAADFLEDFTSEHRRYSVHGSFVDSHGRGIAMMGASGAGKTTLTYGLLLDNHFSFVTDDWFFVRFANSDSLIFSSERNSYIRDNLGEIWPEYKHNLVDLKKDIEDRAVVDVKHLLGGNRIRNQSNLQKIVLLTREKGLPPIKKMTKSEAINFMVKNDFCNPHQLVRTKEKMTKRKNFFNELFARVPVYLLNTTETPKQSLDRIKQLFKEDG